MTSTHESPKVGMWYLDRERSERFEIVATDDKENIELQYFDGEIEEIDLDTWYGMHIIAIAPPKDWSGPYELEKDDYQELKGEVQHPVEGHLPLDSFE